MIVSMLKVYIHLGIASRPMSELWRNHVEINEC